MSKLIFYLFIILVLCAEIKLGAQTGTPHGVALTWAYVQGSDTAVGFNVYQCSGTCTPTGTWAKIDTTLVIPDNYMVPAASLTVNSTYSWAVTAVDATGSESAFSNIATLTIPAAFPSNPNPPTGCSGKVQ